MLSGVPLALPHVWIISLAGQTLACTIIAWSSWPMAWLDCFLSFLASRDHYF